MQTEIKRAASLPATISLAFVRTTIDSDCRRIWLNARTMMENVIAALTAFIDPVSLMSRIAEQTCMFTPKAEGAVVALCTDDRLAVVSSHGLTASLLGNVMPLQDTFQELALQTRTPQVANDATVDERLSTEIRELAVRLGVHTWVVIPLYYQNKSLGALSVVASTAHAFSCVDVAGMASTSRFISALIGSHSEMTALLDDLLNDDADSQTSPTARFLASLLIPNLARHDHLNDRMDALMANPNNFDAAFQPIVDLQTNKTLGFEGLCRFPGTKDMNPSQWFSTARGLGRGMALEKRALCTVLEAARDIPTEYDIGVNLSPLAALDPSMQEILLGVDRQLVLELTEHEPFPQELSAGLEPLREKGILLAIDDAGAGFASFTQLLRLRPDIIKIDGELTRGIEHDSVRRALASSIVQFAAELRAHTVAESIENVEQREVVQRLGIPRGQGFFLGRPLPAKALFPSKRHRHPVLMG